jgi:hypothetical protein
VDDAEDRVAILHAGGDDAQCEQIVDLVDGGLRLYQLVVDAVEALDAPFDAGLDVVLMQALGEQAFDSGEELLAFGAAGFDGFVELLPGDGVDPAEGQVFELAAEFAHAEAMGEGRVDVEGFAGDGALALGREVLEGAHVVQAVGELDEDDADIADHSEEHLADVLGLAVFAIGELDFVDFGDALDDVGDLLAEFGDDVFGGDGGVFDGVVEEAGGDGGGVELHLGEDEGDLQRMEDVGLAGGAELAVMVLEAELPGLADDVGVVGGTIGVDGVQEPAKLLPEQVRDPLNGERGGLNTRHDPLYAGLARGA